MPHKKWKSPLLDWAENNQEANIAFTLVARNERAKQMWADPHNSSRYVPASFTRGEPRDRSIRQTTPDLLRLEKDDEQPKPKEKEETEPALQFLFNNWPKNYAKGFVLGSYDKPCDVLLGDPGDYISEQMLSFTFNEHHELIMNVTSGNPTSVTFNDQKLAERTRFSWIFPRGQKMIRVKVARVLEFDVAVPEYGINKDEFHRNCEKFLSLAAGGDLLADDLGINSIAATRQASGTSSPEDPFYLRGKILGSGSYGKVYKVLRMPDGKTFAAKKFEYPGSFRQEVDMLKKVCDTSHKYIVQFVEEWHGDYKPLLIMEYVAGGNLQKMRVGLSFDDIANLANQTLAALVFLHGQGVMHRDIKPANILCVSPNHYKLADFGVSKEVAPLLSKQGTAEYMAPEVHGQVPYSYPADMWSLGVVLFQCMDDLPDGRPGPDGREWCEEVFSKFIKYHRKCEVLLHMNGDDDFELILLVKNAMLHMNPDDRWSAQRCLRCYRSLWKDLGSGENIDAGSGANTPTQAHPNRSFPPPSLSTSIGDEAGEETSIIVCPIGRKPQHFRNEERSVVGAQSKAGSSFRGSFPPSLPSNGGGQIYDPSVIPSPPSIDGGKIYDPSSGTSFPPPTDGGKFYDPSTVIHRSPSSGGGKLYDPGHFFPSSPSVSAVQKHTRSISDGSIKRRRDSHASADGEFNDGSVTPGRRAPYRPGNEVAAPGLDYFPANQGANSSASNHKRSRSSASKPNAAAQARPIQRSQSSNLARQSAKEA